MNVNLLAEEKAAFGREAYSQGMPFGAWMRRAMLREYALTQPEDAERLKKLRRDYAIENAEKMCQVGRRSRATQLSGVPEERDGGE